MGSVPRVDDFGQSRTVVMTRADTSGQGNPGLFSVGHSNHPFGVFVELLEKHRIEVVADVRTSPYSRYNPQYNRRDLQHGLQKAGLRYIFLGRELGGRPEGEEFYDSRGKVVYGRVAESDRFQGGLARLSDGGERFRVAVLCGEEDPKNCHRLLLVTRALQRREVSVSHIRGDGTLQSTGEIAAFEPEHPTLLSIPGRFNMSPARGFGI